MSNVIVNEQPCSVLGSSYHCRLHITLQTLLTAETDDRAPIIYLRDVAFSELECLLQFIYSGRTSVPGADLASFLGLARSLGVRGFTEEQGRYSVLS